MTGNNNSSTGTVSTTTTANGSSNLEIAQSNQDLLEKKQKKKKSCIVTTVIVLVVLAIVVAVIVLIVNSKGEEENKPSHEALAPSLDDFLHGKFAPKTFNGTWASGHEIIYSDSTGNIVLMNFKENTTRVLIDANDPLSLTAFDFQLSGDGMYLLVAHNYGKLYRHSYLAQYSIIDLETGEKTELITGGIPVQLAIWSPTNNSLVFVYQNNIFYKSSVTAKEQQITSTDGYISNGVPDWVYEEEVLSSNKALWFSPDGKKLAYGRFNDSDVTIMVIPVYGEPGKLHSQYPRANLIKYPKAGTINPTVTLHYVDLANPSTEYDLRVPSNITKEHILASVEWGNNDAVTAIWMNRVQNQAFIVSYDTSKNPTAVITVAGLFSPAGWLELFTPPIFSKNGSQFVLILSQDQGGDAGAFRHIVLYKNEENSDGQALTKGQFVVTEIIGWDHEDDTIFYLANTEESSSVQHLYSVSPDTKEMKCHTCHLKSKYNSSLDCLYNTVEFSKTNEFYFHTCAGPDVPQVSVFTKSGEKSMTWNNNEELSSYIRQKMVPKIKKMEFDIADGFKAKALLRLPPNMDISGETKYPMLVNVYGGPDTYQVTDKFSLDWGSYLAANKSIIYAAIDGRGSGLRGDKLMLSGYRKLGTVEVIDQINVTQQIQKSLPYVDPSRTAIWGWSYGGYVSGMALASDKEGVFKCGISVAPVTDWALYDSIYTERFMGLPTVDDNLVGYENAQLLKNFEGLRDKEYFLIHGTHDDNVHYQQSMMWSRVLELNDILFRQQSYPDEDHNLSLVRPHLYHSLESFLDECFIGNEE